MASWQEKLNSSRARLSHLSDVTFVVGEPPEQKRFQLHKLILSKSSDVFFTMFYGSLPEMREVKVPDIQPDIFEIMMTYVYEDSFSVETVEQAMYTFCASEKYNILHLRDLCIVYITDNLNPEDIPILYKIPVLLENLQILSKCKTVLSLKTSLILTSENFANVPLDMVKDIVQLENMDIPNESILFELVLEWAESFCRKENPTYTTKALREVMDHFLPHIRFLDIGKKILFFRPVESGILSASEFASIYKNIEAPGCQELPVWCYKGISRNTTNIFPLTDRHAFSLTATNLTSIKCFRFMCSSDILFKGVSVYMKVLSVLNTSLEIKLVVSTKRSCYTLTRTKCSYDSETFLWKCMLLEPFPLGSGKNYKISLIANSSIFSECDIVHFGNIVRRNQDFEIYSTSTLAREMDDPCTEKYQLGVQLPLNNNVECQYSIPFRCVHFYEIFYSKF